MHPRCGPASSPLRRSRPVTTRTCQRERRRAAGCLSSSSARGCARARLCAQKSRSTRAWRCAAWSCCSFSPAPLLSSPCRLPRRSAAMSGRTAVGRPSPLGITRGCKTPTPTGIQCQGWYRQRGRVPTLSTPASRLPSAPLPLTAGSGRRGGSFLGSPRERAPSPFRTRLARCAVGIRSARRAPGRSCPQRRRSWRRGWPRSCPAARSRSSSASSRSRLSSRRCGCAGNAPTTCSPFASCSTTRRGMTGRSRRRTGSMGAASTCAALPPHCGTSLPSGTTSRRPSQTAIARFTLRCSCRPAQALSSKCARVGCTRTPRRDPQPTRSISRRRCTRRQSVADGRLLRLETPVWPDRREHQRSRGAIWGGVTREVRPERPGGQARRRLALHEIWSWSRWSRRSSAPPWSWHASCHLTSAPPPCCLRHSPFTGTSSLHHMPSVSQLAPYLCNILMVSLPPPLLMRLPIENLI
mmetsp:Transcript_25392/g.82084  ORF Transcript_25392/g.82084 Transcript_25392/m.82084 type:complete len:468 (+) Transcript_25392:227-1630(+)